MSRFVEQARRAQVVEEATHAFAELGYTGASMVRIADRLGVSRALLNYHFRNRQTLVEAVVDQIYAAGRAEVGPGVERAPTAQGRLAAFITGSVAFYRDSPHRIRALQEIAYGTRTSSWQPVRRHRHQEIIAVAAVLRAGQRSGELGEFDPVIMARSIRCSLDGLFDTWWRDPDTDLDRYAAELVRLFTAATRKE